MARQGARAKLRAFFLEHVGETLDSATLREAAGGISEWARRIRELRNEEGYKILTPDRPSALKLLSALRRARGVEQLEVLEWLIGKFPKQASECVAGDSAES